MTDQVIIPARFCGPPESGNGGWTCGTLAAFVDGRAEVTLRKPPPLDRALDIDRVGLRVCLVDGDEVIAEAQPTDHEPEPTGMVDESAAGAAEGRYEGLVRHPFSSCFTCGPDRAPDDGLRIFPGPVEGRVGTVASLWSPRSSVADDQGVIPEAIVWAALDCPSGWAHITGGNTAVLGRMTARIVEPVRVDERYVVVGTTTDRDGRKRFANSALYAVSGDLVASAKTTWITVNA